MDDAQRAACGISRTVRIAKGARDIVQDPEGDAERNAFACFCAALRISLSVPPWTRSIMMNVALRDDHSETP